MRHYVVRALVSQFAELAGYRGAFGLTISRDRFEREIGRRREAVRIDETGDYGITIVGNGEPFVWINPATNITMRRLARTTAHEAVHVALPELPHGRGFDQRVARLLRLERL